MKQNDEGISSATLSSRLQRMVELKMLHGVATFANLSPEIATLGQFYMNGDPELINRLQQGLRDIHIYKIGEPKLFWRVQAADNRPAQ